MRKIAITLTLLCVAAFAQQKGTFKDTRDKKTYKTVKIGTQTWLAENLNYATDTTTSGFSYCYEGKPANCTKYGRLYFYKQAIEVCPQGWHLPSDREWQILVDFAGGKDAGKNLKAKSGWDNKGNGTDKFGFSALPSGSMCNYTNEPCDVGYYSIGTLGSWFSTKGNWRIYDGLDSLISDNSYANSSLGSVRCVQGDAEAAAKAEEEAKAAEEKAKADAEAKVKAEAEAKVAAKAAELKANSGTFVDSRDKKTYKTIKIGTQIWLAENLTFNANGSKCYNNNPTGCEKYGRLYDWKTALTSCPSGWHLPTDAEWDALMTTVGGPDLAGEKLKAKDGWNKGGSGDDDYGFSAAPGGSGIPNGSSFTYKNNGDFGSFWSATENKDNTKSNYRRMLYTSKNVGSIDDPKTHLFSVRCLKGEGGAEAKAAAAAQPAAKEQPKDQPKQSSTELCSITLFKKTCSAMPKGACKMAGGKVVDKCP